MATPIRAHVVVGGFPPGSHGGHDMDYARLRLLQALQSDPRVNATVSSDFSDCHKWIRDCQLLLTYVAGPYANDHETGLIRDWLAEGGRWLALHGSSGGKAVRLDASSDAAPDVPTPGLGFRRLVKTSYHDALGGRFISHPPIQEFQVDVVDGNHVLTHNLPASFQITDEPYMVQVLHPETRVLLATSAVPPPPAEVQDRYGGDLSLLPDGRSRALGFVREIGKGGVAYIAPGHCSPPPPGKDQRFRGPWDTAEYQQLLENAIAWGTGVEG